MERQHINPAGIYKHPAFTRVVTVSGPARLVFIAGQTPSDENYRCVAPGDYRAQYLHVINNLGIQLAAAGATWDDVVFKRTFTLDVDALGKVTRDPADTTRFLPDYDSGDHLHPNDAGYKAMGEAIDLALFRKPRP